METENFGAHDLQREYLSTLRATRVASTVLLLLCGTWCWLGHRGVQAGAEMLENLVSGGHAALPTLTQLVIKYGMWVVGAGELAVFCALAYNWFGARRLSQVIVATTAGAGVPLLVLLLFRYAIASPMDAVFTNFAG